MFGFHFPLFLCVLEETPKPALVPKKKEIRMVLTLLFGLIYYDFILLIALSSLFYIQ